jgi:hypothetical protein
VDKGRRWLCPQPAQGAGPRGLCGSEGSPSSRSPPRAVRGGLKPPRGAVTVASPGRGLRSPPIASRAMP